LGARGTLTLLNNVLLSARFPLRLTVAKATFRGVPIRSGRPFSFLAIVVSPRIGNILLRQRNPQGALHEYQEYLRLDPDGSMAPGVRQMIEKLQKSLHR